MLSTGNFFKLMIEVSVKYQTSRACWTLVNIKSWSPFQLCCVGIKFLNTAQKISIKYFFSKCDQIRRKMRIWSHLLKKSLTENFIFLLCKIKWNHQNMKKNSIILYILLFSLLMAWKICYIFNFVSNMSYH